MIRLWRARRGEPETPHWLFLRVLVDCVLIVGVVGVGVLAKAWATGQVVFSSDPFPWAAIIQGAVSLGTALLAWVIRGEIQNLHVTFNSKMDEYMKLAKLAARAEGVLEGRATAEALTAAKSAAHAEGVIEGKGDSPKGAP